MEPRRFVSGESNAVDGPSWVAEKDRLHFEVGRCGESDVWCWDGDG